MDQTNSSSMLADFTNFDKYNRFSSSFMLFWLLLHTRRVKEMIPVLTGWTVKSGSVWILWELVNFYLLTEFNFYSWALWYFYLVNFTSINFFFSFVQARVDFMLCKFGFPRHYIKRKCYGKSISISRWCLHPVGKWTLWNHLARCSYPDRTLDNSHRVKLESKDIYYDQLHLSLWNLRQLHSENPLPS